MEITQEFTEKHGLSEDAVKEIGTLYSDSIAEKELSIEKKYKGVANANAEAILGGATNSIVQEFGLELKRNEGEKITDFLTRAKDSYSSNLNKLKEDASKGIDSKEYLDLKSKYDESLIKLSDFDSITEKAGKYDNVYSENLQLKTDNAFNSIKPNFSTNANKYEVDAVWGAFKKETINKYDIENVDGVYKAIDKENHHKIKNLSDLAKEHDAFSTLTGERNQGGLGLENRKTSEDVRKDGLPFSIPKNATKEQISEAINSYLSKEKTPSSKRNEIFGKYWLLATK